MSETSYIDSETLVAEIMELREHFGPSEVFARVTVKAISAVLRSIEVEEDHTSTLTRNMNKKEVLQELRKLNNMAFIKLSQSAFRFDLTQAIQKEIAHIESPNQPTNTAE